MKLIDTRILRVSYFDVMYYLVKVWISMPEQKLSVLLTDTSELQLFVKNDYY